MSIESELYRRQILKKLETRIYILFLYQKVPESYKYPIKAKYWIKN